MEESLLERKWSFFFDLMDHDKNRKWNLKDFVLFSEKIYTLYAVNNLHLDATEFMYKSKKVFSQLLRDMDSDTQYITKKQWIKFLKDQSDNNSTYFHKLIYAIAQELFDVCDQNRDNFLSEYEITELYKILGLTERTASEAVEFLDLNNDLKISKAEFYEGVKDFFENPVKETTLFGNVYELSDAQIVE